MRDGLTALNRNSGDKMDPNLLALLWTHPKYQGGRIRVV